MQDDDAAFGSPWSAMVRQRQNEMTAMRARPHAFKPNGTKPPNDDYCDACGGLPKSNPIHTLSAWRLRIWCNDCSGGQDPQGCFDGGETVSDEVFASKEEAESWGTKTIDGPWDCEAIEGAEPRAGELARLPPDCQRACIGRDHSFKDGHVCKDGACDPACKPCDQRAQWYEFGSLKKLYCDRHRVTWGARE